MNRENDKEVVDQVIKQGIKRKKNSSPPSSAASPPSSVAPPPFKNPTYTIVTRLNMRKKAKSEAGIFSNFCPPPPPHRTEKLPPPPLVEELPPVPHKIFLEKNSYDDDSFEHLSNWSSYSTSNPSSTSSCIYVSSSSSSSSSANINGTKKEIDGSSRNGIPTITTTAMKSSSNTDSTFSTPSQEEESIDNFDNYHVNTELGKGTFAKVFLGVRKKDKQPVVLKMTKDCEILPSVSLATTTVDSGKGPKKTDCWQLRHEHEILKSIPPHPNIVSCLGFFDEGVAACLVLEHAAHGDLFSYMKKGKFNFCEENAKKVLKQLVHAVDHLHHHGIVHRDLKVENILLFDPHVNLVKICDFGLASNHHHKRWQSLQNLREYCQDEPIFMFDHQGKVKKTSSSESSSSSSKTNKCAKNFAVVSSLSSAATTTDRNVEVSLSVYSSILKSPCGSVCYAAPELFVSPVEYNASVDVWSLGVILYIMLHGEFPFLGETTALTIKKICLGKYITFCQMSKDCEDILKRTILVDPLKRLTIKEMKNHPFLK